MLAGLDMHDLGGELLRLLLEVTDAGTGSDEIHVGLVALAQGTPRALDLSDLLPGIEELTFDVPP